MTKMLLALAATVAAALAGAAVGKAAPASVDCRMVGHPSPGVTVGVQLSGVPRSWCTNGFKVVQWNGAPAPYQVRCDFLNARIAATASVYSNSAAAGRRFCGLFGRDLLTMQGTASGWRRVF